MGTDRESSGISMKAQEARQRCCWRERENGGRRTGRYIKSRLHSSVKTMCSAACPALASKHPVYFWLPPQTPTKRYKSIILNRPHHYPNDSPPETVIRTISVRTDAFRGRPFARGNSGIWIKPGIDRAAILKIGSRARFKRRAAWHVRALAIWSVAESEEDGETGREYSGGDSGTLRGRSWRGRKVGGDWRRRRDFRGNRFSRLVKIFRYAVQNDQCIYMLSNEKRVCMYVVYYYFPLCPITQLYRINIDILTAW